ncbi:MAG TPA: DUF2277 domain-containing protein, partial [Acidimicrobiales bacterium]|nr:DUF2277 domain-containing protein [Acidimicrobiales bacterium]
MSVKLPLRATLCLPRDTTRRGYIRERRRTGSTSASACSFGHMCRNITILRGLEPPATHEEVEAAALQYVRKVSGVRA